MCQDEVCHPNFPVIMVSSPPTSTCKPKRYFFLKFIYLWLCWVFVSVRGLSLIAASGGHSSSRCADLSLSRPLLLRSTGSRRAGSAIVAHGPSRSAACGIFPDQGSNPCPLHWQADSQPLHHQGSPKEIFLSDSSLSRFLQAPPPLSFLSLGYLDGSVRGDPSPLPWRKLGRGLV